MSIQTVADIRTHVLIRLQSNTATDPPVDMSTATEAGMVIMNSTYRLLKDLSGTSTTKSTHATLWTPSPATVGTILLTGAIATVKELLRVFISSTVGSTGLETDPAVTYELDKMELSELQYRRRTSDFYGQTVAYAEERPEPAAVADVQKINLHLWPQVQTASRYFPAHYVKTQTDLVNASDVPDLTEAEQDDLVFITAARIAPLIDRTDLVEGLLADVSQTTQTALGAKLRKLNEPRKHPDEILT